MELKCSFKNFNGDVVECNFIPLKRKEAAEIFHKSISTAIGIVQEGFLGVDFKSELEIGMAIAKGLKAIDFELFWSIAERVLKFAIINGKEITDLNTTEYFEKHPEELYLATFHAIKENFPGVFFQLAAGLSGSGQ